MRFQSATTIFATKERQEILSSAGINYAVDMDLYFVFENSQDRAKAYKILEAAFSRSFLPRKSRFLWVYFLRICVPDKGHTP